MTLAIKQMPDSLSFWMVTDGEQQITICPCCGKSLTEKGAQALVRYIETGKASFEAMLQIAAFIERERKP